MNIHAERFINKKLLRIIAIIAIIAAIPLTVFIAQKQQELRKHASTGCDTNDNLVRNCNFEQLNASGFPIDWIDTSNDPKRQAAPGQYTKGVGIATTAENLRAAQIGRETGTCEMPKNADGGDTVAGPYKLYSEIRQYVYVGRAETFTLSFDFQMKSRQTATRAAPFYVWAAFSEGREVFLAYTPHNDESTQYCNAPFRTDYVCLTGLSGFNRTGEEDCSEVFTSWKHVEVTFPRAELCKPGGPGDSECLTVNDELVLGFGATNDYDTVILVDNVSLRTPGIDRSSTPRQTNLYVGTDNSVIATGSQTCSAGINLELDNGLTCNGPVSATCAGGNPKDSNPCWWQWNCTTTTPGNYTATFSVPGSPFCTSTQSYNVSPPTPTETQQGELIDTLDYFLTNHPDKGLTGTHPLSQTIDGQKSYLVKWSPANFEIHIWDNDYIYLKEDNSGQPVNFYTFTPGTWMKRQMRVGEKITVSNNMIQWYTPTCQPDGQLRSFPIEMTLERHDPNFDIGGDLGRQDVIVLKYDSSVGIPSGLYERIYYSKEWGFILWEEYSKATNAITHTSTFNKITDTPLAPDKNSACDPSLRPPVVPSTTPTATPTATITATITPSPTALPGTTQLSFTFALHGIGQGGDNVTTQSSLSNKNPRRTTREVIIQLLNANNQEVARQTASALFQSNGIYTASATFTNITSGNYFIKAKVNNYLTRLVPGIQSLTAGQPKQLPQIALVSGDVNNDNALDALDWNILVGCFSEERPAKSCDASKKDASDLTDDGQVTLADVNLFLRELSVRSGD